MDVGWLCLCELWWLCQKNSLYNREPTATLDPAPHNIQGLFFNINHDVTLYYLAPLIKIQQFFTATVVRKCLVALSYAILYVGKDFLRNNISKTVTNYSGKRNSLEIQQKTKQTYKYSLQSRFWKLKLSFYYELLQILYNTLTTNTPVPF
jgi:hypothetical protein